LYFIDEKEVLTYEYLIYAHTCGEERELLEEHINRCKFYFEKIYKEKEIEKILQRFVIKMNFHDFESSFQFIRKMLFQVIVFHDFGKLNPTYQKQTMKNEKAPEKFPGLSGTNHSLLSSIIYIDYFWDEINKNPEFDKKEKQQLKLMIIEHAYIISKHHGNLESFTDYLNSSEEMKNLIRNLREYHLLGYKGIRCIAEDTIEKELMPRRIYKKRNKLSREQSISKFFYYRLVYSLLVASDYYATTEFMQKIKSNDIGHTFHIQDFWNAYQNTSIAKSIQNYRIQKYQKKQKEGRLDQITDINELRSEIFLDAENELKKHIEEENSLFFLEAPTGGGKSNTAINLSFHLMKNKKKLFYIYPFNTLVEQNRKTLRELFPDEKLQEKIAVVNSLIPIKEKENPGEDSIKYYQESLLDRQFLNYDFILSTHVSFFNLLFGHKKEDIFGFFQLIDAVIVLDEIQSYKNTIWAEMIIFLKNCVDLFGMKIIIMSATLPNLEILGGKNCEVVYLLPDSSVYFQHVLFKNRVNISYELLEHDMTIDKLLKHVSNNCSGNQKILVEFVKKNTAYAFYQKLSQSNEAKIPIMCITGDDSIYEREKILKPIQENILSEVILVATQVIEAGVDIDMDIGYKDISIIDSEEQFIGRINRSCKRSGKVYFFDLDDSNIIYRDDYRMDDTLTLKNVEMRDVLNNKNFSFYYKKLLKTMKMDQNECTGRMGLKYFFENEVAKLNFPEIEKRMRLIKEDDWNMNIVLCRRLKLEDGSVLDGIYVWEQYKELLYDQTMDYAQKQIELSKVRSQLNYFTYQIKKNDDLAFNDMIGELRCIYDGEKYFKYGKLDRTKLETDGGLFF